MRAKKAVPHLCPMSDIKTLSEFIVERQAEFPYASGDLSSLLTAFRLAGKIVNREVNKAGLAGRYPRRAKGPRTCRARQQQKLDVYANNLFIRMMRTQGAVCAVASEENDDIVHFDNGGKYVVTMDPLDGSSNIDVNVSIGTIFSIYKRISTGPKATMEDFLQPGTRRWPQATSCTAAAPCSCTARATASTASRSTPASAPSA
jgi:fructose-1,6-bisphosphatase I